MKQPEEWAEGGKVRGGAEEAWATQSSGRHLRSEPALRVEQRAQCGRKPRARVQLGDHRLQQRCAMVSVSPPSAGVHAPRRARRMQRLGVGLRDRGNIESAFVVVVVAAAAAAAAAPAAPAVAVA